MMSVFLLRTPATTASKRSRSTGIGSGRREPLSR